MTANNASEPSRVPFPEPTATHAPMIHRGVTALTDAWQSASAAAGEGAAANEINAANEVNAVADVLAACDDATVVSLLDAAGVLKRQLDGFLASLAHSIHSRSDRSLGADALARAAGHRNPAQLLEERLQIRISDARSLIAVGCSITGPFRPHDERGPAETEHVAASFARGEIGLSAAHEIVEFTQRVAPRAGREDIAVAEELLVKSAPSLNWRGLQVAIDRAEKWIDPNGVAPAIETKRDCRSLTLKDHADGSLTLKGRFDPISAAPIRTALTGDVNHHLRTHRGENIPTGNDGLPDSLVAVPLHQLQADALSAIFKHSLGCDMSKVPGSAAKTIVRIPLAALGAEPMSGDASTLGEIDGGGVIDPGTARLLAATSGVIPSVFNSKSVVVDHGREIRHFTAQQRQILAERDGGCAFCGLPAAMTEAHHRRWWKAHAGKTDLDNGVLLCMTCHHRAHEGWDIVVIPEPGETNNRGAGTVWFLPPGRIDPLRTPRLGGRKRFDPVFRSQHPPIPPPEHAAPKNSTQSGPSNVPVTALRANTPRTPKRTPASASLRWGGHKRAGNRQRRNADEDPPE
ncbi:MAG: DUF222 domain-containing protein [Gulosibacter sp.]|uniref:HNH endonuclease n=1 Tax=Gulosibacter sp. TaxID=2817531 RepID=UPI003F8DDA8F